MPCLFCAIIAGEIPCYKVYEDDSVFAILDIGPVSKGHTLLFPKIHAANLQEGSLVDAQHLMTALYAITPSILKTVGADGYNLGMNHGECAGQEVLHTHLHIMPRTNGVPRSFTKTHPSKEELAVTAEAIRAELQKVG